LAVNTSEYLATAATFAVLAVGLWAGTRKSKVRYIRWQWRRPHWILLRLFILVLAFHGLFALLDVHPAIGFLCVGMFSLFALGDFGGLLTAAVLGVGWGFYQWIFWLPSRRQLILRNPRPFRRSHGSELVGVEGVAASDLRPTGIIRVLGTDRNARSEFGLIARGEKVVVESVGDFEVNVRKTDGQQGAAPNSRQPSPFAPSPDVQAPDSLRTPWSGGCG